MTYLLASIVAGAVASVGAALAIIVWLVRKILAKDDRIVADLADMFRLELNEQGYKTSLDDHKAALIETHAQFQRETAARKEAERIANEAIHKLAESGDPDSVADDLRLALGRLQSLVQKAKSLPGTDTDNGGDSEAVHGTSAEADSGAG